MIKYIKYNKSAFTLIEITIALLVLTIGLIGILALFPVGFDAQARASHKIKATFVAQTLLEKRKILDYDSVDDMERTPAAAPYNSFQYKIDVTIDPDSLGLDLKLVEVYVYVGSASDPIVTLSTCIAKYEP